MESEQRLRRVEGNQLIYYALEAWDGLKHAIFTRAGGMSAAPWAGLNVGGTVGDAPQAVYENHQLMYSELGVDPAQTVTTWQIHSSDVVVAHHPVAGRRWLARADALITDRPGLALVMRFADCVPLLYYDRRRGVIGIAHAGWRGTVQGIASATVRAMQAVYQCDPADIEVMIGPSISIDHFQVGEEVVDAVESYFGTLQGLMRRDPDDNTAYIDLWAANRLDLERAGVDKVTIAEICTYARTDEFFSHRAERGRTGRFGVVMSL